MGLREVVAWSLAAVLLVFWIIALVGLAHLR